MSQIVSLFVAPNFTPATLTAQLATAHATNPISLLVFDNISAAEQAAAVWAQKQGIKLLFKGAYLDGAGYTAFNRLNGILASMVTQPASIVTAGVHAKTNAAANVASARGIGVTSI